MYSAIDAELCGRHLVLTCFCQPCTCLQGLAIANVVYALQCDGCRALVHMDCYGLEAPPQGQSWLCDVCSLGAPGLVCYTLLPDTHRHNIATTALMSLAATLPDHIMFGSAKVKSECRIMQPYVLT